MTEVNREQGTRPLVTAGRKNCGVSSFISNENQKIFSKTSLTIDMFANTFFRDYQFSADDNILVLNNKTLSKETLIFISAVLDSINYYTYGKQYRLQNFYRQFVSLPITSIKKPNWDYMEQYIVNIVNNIEIPNISSPVSTPIKLNSQEWKPFLVSDLFDVNKEPGSENNMAALKSGNTPLISARKFDNGLKGLVTVEKTKVKQANTITWNKDGDGGAGLAYYQPFEYAVDSHVFVLYPKLKEINKHSMLFILPLLSQYKDIFGHGLANNKKRFKILKILLPVTSDNKPNWQFMEKYIKSISNSNLI